MVRVLAISALAALALVQAQPPPDILFFARARARMQDHLKNQPNYICLETVERTQRDPSKKRSSLLDVLRLEVAFVGNKELYAWPGSNRFEETELGDMVPAGGSIGTGAFATHAYNLFLSNGPRTLPGEWTEVEGRRAAQFPYDVAEMVSGYRIRVARGDWAVVGYYGSIWIDADREEVMRIEVIADQIPVRLGLKESRTNIYYGDVRIGDQVYRLPVRTIELSTTFGGHENRNEGRFTACRQFVGESKLSFGDPPPEETPSQAVRPLSEISLPEGLPIRLDLVTPIDSDHAKTGDAIEAVLASAIKQKKQVLFEKGSRVDGRLVRLQRRGNEIEAELQFFSIVSATQQARFTARPEVESPQQALPSFATQAPGRRTRLTAVDGHAGAVRVEVESSRLSLPKGSRTNWITSTVPPERPPQ